MSTERALIVDDDDSWRDLIQELLEDNEFQVDTASTLDQAVALIKSTSHRLAVIDLSLGGADHRNQDGLAVLEQIRSSDPQCKSVLLTGYATVELAVEVITQGKAFTCLRKESFSRSDFRALLQQAASAAPRVEQGQGVVKRAASKGRALVVEDDAGWRELLAELLADSGLEVVACTSFAEARGHFQREEWQLAVIDLELSSSLQRHNQDGLELLEVAHAAGVPALVVSGTGSIVTIEKAFQAKRVFGFFEKQSFERKAFLEVVEGGLQPSVLDVLTEREREVLELLAEGLTNVQIGERLFISANTVKRHLKAVFEKLQVSNRAQAAALITSASPGRGE